MASKKPSLAGDGLGLFTDFVQGIRQGLKLRGGSDKQLEALRDERVIAAVVNLLMVPISVALQFLDRTVVMTMDLSKTLSQLITDGKYDGVNSDIAENFSIKPGSGTRTTEIPLLHYNKMMTSDQVLADMDRQGLRAATFLELLWLGIQHPKLQLDFPIVALGTVVLVDGSRYVACLGRYVRGRSLGLDWFGGEWHERDRFAAVHK